MAKQSRMRAAMKEAEQTLRNKPRVATVYFLLRFAVIAVMVAQFFNRNFENVFKNI